MEVPRVEGGEIGDEQMVSTGSSDYVVRIGSFV